MGSSSGLLKGRVRQGLGALAVVAVVSLTVFGCASPGQAGQPTLWSPWLQDQQEAPKPFEVRVSVNPRGSIKPVNRLLLGQNIDWAQGSDDLLNQDTLEFSQSVMEDVFSLNPTVLRYPGGLQAAFYDWSQGTGPMEERGEGLHAQTHANRKIMFGTWELLRLCQRVGAEPLITVNIITGTDQGAAQWVNYTNKGNLKDEAGSPLPEVKYWELGSEPYLISGEHALDAAAYARKANRFIEAMRTEDPDIQIGIPLRSEKLGARKNTNPYKNYDETVLKNLTARFDFVSVHNAYFPMLQRDEKPNMDDLYRATMAATLAVADDLDLTRRKIEKAFPDRKIPFAVTEYNALFSLGQETDRLIATPAGALYVADLLRLFAERDDILLASYWTLSDDWFFGALDKNGMKRPAYDVLRMYSSLLYGEYIPLAIETPKFSSPAAASVPAYKNIPRVVGLATRDGQWVRILLINKDPAQPAGITIENIDSRQWIAFEEWTTEDVWGNEPFNHLNGRLMETQGTVEFQIDPHSMMLLRYELPEPT